MKLPLYIHSATFSLVVMGATFLLYYGLVMRENSFTFFIVFGFLLLVHGCFTLALYLLNSGTRLTDSGAYICATTISGIAMIGAISWFIIWKDGTTGGLMQSLMLIPFTKEGQLLLIPFGVSHIAGYVYCRWNA